MTIKKIYMQKGDTIPTGCMRMESAKPPAQLKITKEVSGDKFIDNLEKINRDRVNPKKEHQEQEL